MADGEIYPSAPLVSVAFELRHPAAETLTTAQRSAVQKILGDRFPLVRSHKSTTQMVQLGPAGPATETTTEEFPRYFNRSRTSVMSFTQGSIVLETTEYPGWEKFKPLIKLACEVRNAVSPIYGIERLGLRYVDEVRVEQDRPEWSDWIESSLLSPAVGSSVDLPLRLWQGALVLGAEPGQSLVLRFGPGEGYATDPNADLRRRRPSLPGPFFLLDVDSFWVPEDEVPAFSLDDVLTRVEELHEPVRTVFESSITDRYREDVLRK